MHLATRSTPTPTPTRRGTTVPELATLLLMLGVLASLGIGGARALTDRLVVVSAREEVIGLVHAARSTSVETAGARIDVDVDRDELVLYGGERVRRRIALAERRVDLSTSGSASMVTLRWNRLGWGVVTSRTLVLRRGAAEARVVVSARGRATRR